MSVMWGKNIIDIIFQFNIYYEGFGIEMKLRLTQIFLQHFSVLYYESFGIEIKESLSSTHDSFPHLFSDQRTRHDSFPYFIYYNESSIYIILRPNALLSACFYEGACNNTLVAFCYDLIGVAFSGLHILANRNVFFFFFFETFWRGRDEFAELQACIVPNNDAGKKQYVLQSITIFFKKIKFQFFFFKFLIFFQFFEFFQNFHFFFN